MAMKICRSGIAGLICAAVLLIASCATWQQAEQKSVDVELQAAPQEAAE